MRGSYDGLWDRLQTKRRIESRTGTQALTQMHPDKGVMRQKERLDPLTALRRAIDMLRGIADGKTYGAGDYFDAIRAFEKAAADIEADTWKKTGKVPPLATG
jgi:hypothetical protein